MQLTNEGIVDGINELTEYYKINRINKATIIQNTLSLEEFLTKYQEHFGTECEYSLSMFKRFGSHHAKVEIKGESFNPTIIEDEDEDSFENTFFSAITHSYKYNYTKGTNSIDFITERHHMSSALRLLIAVVAAVLFGVFTKFILPESVALFIADEVIQPLSDTFVGLLGALVGPVVFFTIIVSMVGIGDISSFKKFGASVLKKMFLLFFIIFAASSVLPVLIAGIGSAGETYSPFFIIRDTVLGIVPHDIVSPFSNNSVLQLLFWGVSIGLGFLSLGNQSNSFSSGVTLLNDIFGKIMSLFGNLLPVFIFFSLYLTIVDGTITKLGGGDVLLFYFVGMAGAVVILVFLAWGIAKVNPYVLFKNAISAMITGGVACSSIIVLNREIEDLSDEKKFGLDRNRVNFVTPISQALFKPGNAINYFMIMLGMMKLSNTEISLPMIFTLFVLCFILGIATPPCACSGMAVMTIIFETMNLDPMFLATAITLDAVLDYFTTPISVLGNYVCVLLVTKKK